MKKFLNLFINYFNRVANLFGGRIILMLVGALIIAICTIFFSDRWLQAIETKTLVLRDIRSALVGVADFELDINRAESAQRGYLLTRSEIYLKPYQQAILDSKSSLKVIRTNLEKLGNPAINSEKLVNELSISVENKITEMTLTLQLAEAGNFDEANNIVMLQTGLRSMQEITNNANALRQSLNVRITKAMEELYQVRGIARFSLVFGPLLLILLVVLVIRNLLKELANKTLFHEILKQENTKHEVQLKEQEKLLGSMSLNFQTDVERERQHLAREIHDELGSILTATKMDISWAMKTVRNLHPEVADKLKKTNAYLDQGIRFKRQLVQALHPSMIASFGFWPAFTTLIEDAAERNNWNMKTILPDDTTLISETISLAAYRITQETLTNASKYAKASEVSISLICEEDFLKIEIQDNGIGTNLTGLDYSTHGLSGMRNRVQAIGGHFEVSSQPGKGMFTRVLLPLTYKPALT